MELQKTATNSGTQSMFKAYVLQFIAYLVAIVIAISVAYSFRNLHPVWGIALADIVGTFVIFAFSLSFNNSSFYDPYWSMGPIAIVVALWVLSGTGMGIVGLLTLTLVCFWGIRLTYNFLRGWKGLRHQDWRYDQLRSQTGKWYWLVSFSGIHFFPTLMVFLGCLSLFPIFLYPQAENAITWLAIPVLILGFVAVYVEAKADVQLHAFVKSNKDPQAFLKSGLWSTCRHPNYLGEIGFWWALYLAGLAMNPAWWWTIIGPLAITLMFVFISIPMIDKRMLSKRPKYEAHMKKVRALLPFQKTST